MRINGKQLAKYLNDNQLHVKEVFKITQYGFTSYDFVERVGTPYEMLYVGVYDWVYIGNLPQGEQIKLRNEYLKARKKLKSLSLKQVKEITPDTTWRELELVYFKWN